MHDDRVRHRSKHAGQAQVAVFRPATLNWGRPPLSPENGAARWAIPAEVDLIRTETGSASAGPDWTPGRGPQQVGASEPAQHREREVVADGMGGDQALAVPVLRDAGDAEPSICRGSRAPATSRL